VKKRKSVSKTLERAGTHVETKIARSIFEYFFEMRGGEASGEVHVRKIFEAYEPIFDANGLPNVLPEGDAASVIAEGLRTRVEQAANRRAELVC
jgi:hypothetical protein